MLAQVKKNALLASLLFIGFASRGWPQESVDIPQALQENVRSFNLTIDSLTTLTEGIQVQAEMVGRQLRVIRQRMDTLPAGSRAYYIERRCYEEKLSGFLAQKYATLADMQAMRTQTLAHLEGILNRMQGSDSAAVKPVREKIREQISRNDERLAQTRLDLLQMLSQLKKPGLPPEESVRLSRKVRRLRADRQALQESNQRRLTALLNSASQQNEELPEIYVSLREMWENLQSGFDWIDAEIAYTQLFAEHRKTWLTIDAQLLEVSGLIERFREAVNRINASSAMLKEMEQFERFLNPSANGKVMLPEIPALNWPGKPATIETGQALSAAEIDSLERLLEDQLQKP